MSDHPTCPVEGKICYSAREAGELINSLKHLKRKPKNIPKRSYRCKHCGTFHVTKMRSSIVSKEAYYKLDKR